MKGFRDSPRGRVPSACICAPQALTFGRRTRGELTRPFGAALQLPGSWAFCSRRSRPRWRCLGGRSGTLAD